MKYLTIFSLLGLIAGCNNAAEPTTAEQAPAPTEAAVPTDSMVALVAAALDVQPAEVQARYQYRHPGETLKFFDVQPGMTVVEALPGGGWYTKILLPYLGEKGKVIGMDYSIDLYSNFEFGTEEFLASKENWADTWTGEAEAWREDGSAGLAAFAMGSLPENLMGSADAVLFIRALHNMNNYETAGGFLTEGIADAYKVLKPGGVAGVVQHRSAEEMPDEWANGSNGYLKESYVIEQMTKGGFDYVARADINRNPLDIPTTEDFVWRLPPSLDVGDDEVRSAAMKAIGESDRMTLLFRKPD